MLRGYSALTVRASAAWDTEARREDLYAAALLYRRGLCLCGVSAKNAGTLSPLIEAALEYCGNIFITTEAEDLKITLSISGASLMRYRTEIPGTARRQRAKLPVCLKLLAHF